ncbi:hypothetical protein G9A89_018638 [Geosiphon pyriformis]|nr:hypothetical protein G9A89_018638 [Geosiphon pyriformis]
MAQDLSTDEQVHIAPVNQSAIQLKSLSELCKDCPDGCQVSRLSIGQEAKEPVVHYGQFQQIRDVNVLVPSIQH